MGNGEKEDCKTTKHGCWDKWGQRDGEKKRRREEETERRRDGEKKEDRINVRIGKFMNYQFCNGSYLFNKSIFQDVRPY